MRKRLVSYSFALVLLVIVMSMGYVVYSIDTTPSVRLKPATIELRVAKDEKTGQEYVVQTRIISSGEKEIVDEPKKIDP